jgi:hypothetical protein
MMNNFVGAHQAAVSSKLWQWSVCSLHHAKGWDIQKKVGKKEQVYIGDGILGHSMWTSKVSKKGHFGPLPSNKPPSNIHTTLYICPTPQVKISLAIHRCYVSWHGRGCRCQVDQNILYMASHIYICMYIQLYTYTSSISLSYLVRVVHTVVSIGLLRRQYLRLQHDSNSASWDNVTQPTTRTRGRDVSQSQLRSTSWDVNISLWALNPPFGIALSKGSSKVLAGEKSINQKHPVEAQVNRAAAGCSTYHVGWWTAGFMAGFMDGHAWMVMSMDRTGRAGGTQEDRIE